MPVTIEVPKEKSTGKVREITLGATAAEGGTRKKTVVVGGETTLPFLHYEGAIPHPPIVAVEIKSRKPDDWSPLLLQAWGAAVNDPGEWAKAAEAAGADLLLLTLSMNDTPDDAKAALKKVLGASGLPVGVFGPGQADKDNELIVPVAEAGAGEKLLLGVCEDKNYRTIVAAALAHGHLVDSRTPMDVNLSKQLIILIKDMGMPLERITMDPSTGGLGYGIEYGYSVMERLRLAALGGDGMTQQPILVTPGEEAWKVKESKVGEGVPAAWGDWKERAINWETLTTSALIESGADVVVLRHPETIKRVKAIIAELMKK